MYTYSCVSGLLAVFFSDLHTLVYIVLCNQYFPQESCQCVQLVASAIPAVFYQQSSSLVKPLLQSMAHQRSKVRFAAMKVNTIVLYMWMFRVPFCIR